VDGVGSSLGAEVDFTIGSSRGRRSAIAAPIIARTTAPSAKMSRFRVIALPVRNIQNPRA
jgi:hypothetical protein